MSKAMKLDGSTNKMFLEKGKEVRIQTKGALVLASQGDKDQETDEEHPEKGEKSQMNVVCW